MSICRGVAGARGRNPKGIFIHNDAGSQQANAAFYRNWLPTHNLGNGFAHAYQADDGLLIAEDDQNMAWHCGQTDGNNNYLSIEVCQSMGDATTFLQNEEKALKWCAEKCKQYNIVPNENTIRLHQDVFATSCPHRSVELHGGADACKAYFIKRIKELMNNNVSPKQEKNERRGATMMCCLYTIDGKGPVFYFDGKEVHPLSHPDEVTILNRIYKDNNGIDIPCYSWSSKAPWYIRLKNAIERVQK